MPGFQSRSSNAMAVWLADDDGNPVSAGGGGGTGGSNTNPTFVRTAQGAPAHSTVTLAAATAATIIASGASTNGARILNWTASPVYVTPGTTGTPNSGAPSDYIPAAASGVPGQYEPPYIPTTGMRAVGASAGDLTVEVW